ncbi:MAG: hypothetical protein DRP97_03790 [Candidatus Latescibacterota bacterium]|nr:MAG: hypothetical protein DRP97_03790 [Candidatus Latescibacterota bacterium]
MDYLKISERQRLYRAGSIIIREGDSEQTMFILDRGTLGVFREGKLITQIEKEGVLFGEMSELLGGARTATIKALSDCLVTVYTGGIDRIVRDFPEISKKLIQILAERLKDTTERYYAFKVKVTKKESASTE